MFPWMKEHYSNRNRYSSSVLVYAYNREKLYMCQKVLFCSFMHVIPFRMSENIPSTSRPQESGLIQLISPPDVNVEERPPLVDFEVIGSMMKTFEARNKDSKNFSLINFHDVL